MTLGGWVVISGAACTAPKSLKTHSGHSSIVLAIPYIERAQFAASEKYGKINRCILITFYSLRSDAHFFVYRKFKTSISGV